MARETVIAFRLNTQQAQNLRRAARQEGRVLSVYLRALVEKAIAERSAGAAQ